MSCLLSGLFAVGNELRVYCIAAILIPALLGSCTSSKKTAKNQTSSVNLDEVSKKPEHPIIYRSSKIRKIDLLHTKLDVSFDWENSYLNGKATLSFTPCFYPANLVELDAKGFDIKKVSLLTDTGKTDLYYIYKDNIITITLNKTYFRTDTVRIYIEYTAKPNELEVKGSAAISDARGLYFINPKGEEKDKPRQIWTQGETESNSCWFPTVDSPNERMTDEIYITVDTNFVTLSNGLLQYSVENGNGTRTDYWKQELPHAPYLVMMAVGEFSIVKDHWKDMEVNYYVEPDYKPYATAIFGHTPEMLQFFSDKLGVEYPWAKYSQVVVRDYISGAMENTTAVIHGSFMQKDQRELLDATGEDVISHELFHHWFGDLVTCESWSNLPLNESFATYGEYLWNEYKYGRDEADYGISQDLQSYLWSAGNKQVDIIRYNYNDKEDMFDSFSYAKGGRVLHMLRKTVGDTAFFESLKLYLNENKFGSVEIHNLRLAFEKITGEDLNWFFNQWFLSPGHPALVLSYDYDDSLKQQSVSVTQAHDLTAFPVYKLPVNIDLYFGTKVERHEVVVDSVRKTFVFKTNAKPDLVNFDSEKMLLCIKNDNKIEKEWIFQYYNAPLYLDRFEAIDALKNFASHPDVIKVMIDALNDSHWNIRREAINNLKDASQLAGYEVRNKLAAVAKNDKKSAVRANAIKQLVIYFNPDSTGVQDDGLTELYTEAAKDSSYSVVGEAVFALSSTDYKKAIELTKSFDVKTQEKLKLTIARIYAAHGSAEQSEFFIKTYKGLSAYEKYNFLELYSEYLLRQDDETINQGLKILEDAAVNEKAWWARLTAVYRIQKLESLYQNRGLSLTKEIKTNKSKPEKLKELQDTQLKVNTQIDLITTSLNNIKNQEKDSRVLQYWGGIPSK